MNEHIEFFKNDIYTLYYTIEKERGYYNYDGPLGKNITVWCHSAEYGVRFCVGEYYIPYNDDGTAFNKIIADIESNVNNKVAPTVIPRIKKSITNRIKAEENYIKEAEEEIHNIMNYIQDCKQTIKNLNEKIEKLKKCL